MPKSVSKGQLLAVEKFSARFRKARMDPQEEREHNHAIKRALDQQLEKFEGEVRPPLMIGVPTLLRRIHALRTAR